MTKYVFIFFIFQAICLNSFGQKCFCISGTKDKGKSIETFGGTTNSIDYFSFLIQKQIQYKDTSIAPKYILFLNAASKVSIADSVLKTKGAMKLLLLDKSIVTIENVTYYNNPLGFCCSLGFEVYITEKEARLIANNPIVSISISNFLATSFNYKQQKKQQKILNCLILRH